MAKDRQEQMAAMRVLLADDTPGVRFALRKLLLRLPGIEVVGEVVDAPGLLDDVEQSCPDLVLLDWELPGLGHVEFMDVIRSCCPRLLVVALSSQFEAPQAALSLGMDAFVSKFHPPEKLLAAIEDCRSEWRSRAES